MVKISCKWQLKAVLESKISCFNKKFSSKSGCCFRLKILFSAPKTAQLLFHVYFTAIYPFPTPNLTHTDLPKITKYPILPYIRYTLPTIGFLISGIISFLIDLLTAWNFFVVAGGALWILTLISSVWTLYKAGVD